MKLAKEIRTGKFAVDEDLTHYYTDVDGDFTGSNLDYVEGVFSDIYEIVQNMILNLHLELLKKSEIILQQHMNCLKNRI